MTTQLAVSNPDAVIAFTPQAQAMKEAALATAELIVTVENQSAQALAVDAQRQLKEVIKAAEEARKLFKAPHLERNKQIDLLHGEWVRSMLAEELRLATALGNYQEQERAKIAHAKNRFDETLSELERWYAKATSEAKSDVESDLVTEEYIRRTKDMGPRPEAEQAKGQRVSEDWQISVVNPFLLASAHPGCVDIKPRLTAIKALLDAGVKVAGVLAKRAVTSTVQIQKPKEIEA